jgi:hypothetical protein
MKKGNGMFVRCYNGNWINLSLYSNFFVYKDNAVFDRYVNDVIEKNTKDTFIVQASSISIYSDKIAIFHNLDEAQKFLDDLMESLK